ncbi:hypothetical protein Tco_0447919 [Tanacetum coccineum]
MDDDLDEEEAIKVTKKKNLENDIVDETLEVDEIINIRGNLVNAPTHRWGHPIIEEPIEIVERDVKKLKQRRIPLVKVRLNSRQGAEYTWEREDQFKTKYPHLFAPTSSAIAS